MGNPPGWVVVARITAARGNRGEVKAEVMTDFPERFRDVVRLRLRGWPRGAEAPVVVDRDVEETWFHQGRLIVKFAGVDSIPAAEALVGWEVVIGGDEVMPLPDGTFYRHDLVGLEVFDTKGRKIGAIREIQATGGVDLLVISAEDGEILVPVAGEFLREVDLEGRRAILDLPDDLRDLNRA